MKSIFHSLFLVILTLLIWQPIFSLGNQLESRIPLRDVQVGGEIGHRMDITIHNNLLVLDAGKDFLQPFQERNRSDGYIGLGKLIDSLVRFSANTNNDRLMALKNHIVQETIRMQEEDGYIGMFVPAKRMWSLWDIHEMTYIANGLVSDYHFFQNQDSLHAAKRLMDYIIRRWTEQPDGLDGIDITIFMAVTGLEETLLTLHNETGDERYLDFCVNFRRLPQWDYPIDLGRWGPIGGHAYAYFHRCLAQLRLHQLQPDENLLNQTRRVLKFLTEQDGLLINGVCSQHECWHDNQDGTEGLGETCATAYMIRLLDELIRMERDSFYGDLMERAIFNGLFAAQSPDGRKLRYYVPFEGERVYFDGDTYCCPCNYRRIVAELPGMVYYRMDDGIAINLFTSSQAVIKLSDGTEVRIQQETDYPNGGLVHLHVDPETPKQFPIFIRIPRWCEKATVTLNSPNLSMETSAGQFFRLERAWKLGDRITINFNMPIRLIKGRKSQAGRVAVMHGPQLYCLNPQRNGDLEGVDLRQIGIDPQTLEGPLPDAGIRPGGTAVKVKGWKRMGFSRGDGNHDLELLLTEFPDPEGRAAYFRIHRLGQVGVEDELVNPGDR
ncbi:MAG: hypothetical protein C4527_26655 [Candidatus Omnitrophota bacterium]|jgi:DUF1680 family protein|nr:MAG: hypothetical protein C4527_26655 [Candidatus Omnitrophota bacterium]